MLRSVPACGGEDSAKTFHFLVCSKIANIRTNRKIKNRAESPVVNSNRYRLQSGPLSLETLLAIYRPTIYGTERNLSVHSTFCTNCRKHFTRSFISAAAVAAPIGAAVPAALGLVLETLFSVKLLFSGRENEFLTTILAD